MQETEEKALEETTAEGNAFETAVQENAAVEVKKSKGKKWGIIGGVTAVIVALAVGIGIYNTPENRLQRQLDLGNRYLQEQQYAEAALAFEKAIAIDERCMAAYAGGLEAYLGTGDAESAKTFYDKTLDMLSGLDADYVTENMDSVVELYLSAEKVYGDDPEKVAEILEGGYEKAGEDQRLKVKLIETYLGIAKEKTEEDAYEEALKKYDRLIELDRENADMIAGLCDCLNKYIDILMKERRYDEIRALAEKYGDIATGVDFKSILAKIAELEKIEADNRAFMKKVYDLMAAQDYEAMHEVDGSEEAAAFVERMENDRYLYFPDDTTSQTGIGAGVYQFGEGGYYFYYGDYANGERKGNGTEFLNQTTGYYVFTGAWDQDVPNGEGTETRVGGLSYNSDARYDMVSSGTLIDGLWDGEVNAVLTQSSNGEKFDLSFSAVKGIPTEDRTEEFMASPWAEELEEGMYIFAFDYHPTTDWAWWNPAREGSPIGIDGFIE